MIDERSMEAIATLLPVVSGGSNSLRDRKMVACVIAGEKITDVGERFGVSHQRVSQIITHYEKLTGLVVREMFAIKPQPEVEYRHDSIFRFLDKVKVDPVTECWEWKASKYPLGYAAFHADGEQYGHRYAYTRYVGPIPDGMHTDHLCRNRGCVNPDHLEVVTPKENFERSPFWVNGCWEWWPDAQKKAA